MAIYKFNRKCKKNNLKITLFWKREAYNILVEESTSKGILRSRVKGIAVNLNRSIAILEILKKECTSREELRDLITEIEDRLNMLILWRTAEICGFYFFTIAI